MSANHDDELAAIEQPVGPFTGFGNFFMKELLDWWKSWRLIVVFIIPTLITVPMVLFAFDEMFRDIRRNADRMPIAAETVATFLILFMFIAIPLFYVFIIVFSTMGLLTTEKSTGTLAWNLTKPLGRTGLLTAKWLAATLMLWLACCVLPVFISVICMKLVHGVTPHLGQITSVVSVSVAWVGFWVLMVLLISLGFQSQAAVGGIAIASFLVPLLFFGLLGHLLGIETRDLILDRWAPRSPSWAFPLVAEGDLRFAARMQGEDTEQKTSVWMLSFAVWFIIMSVVSLRIFNRQEIGS